MARKKLTEELAAAKVAGRSGLLDLYWLAAHGQPVREEAWPAVLWVREKIHDPYSLSLFVAAVLEQLDEKGP